MEKKYQVTHGITPSNFRRVMGEVKESGVMFYLYQLKRGRKVNRAKC